MFRFEHWPTEFRKITQHFGVNPQNYAQFGLPGHEGIDVRAPSGSKIYSVAPGVVHQVHTSGDNHNYGIHVRVNHADNFQTIYAHLQEAHVTEGEIVQAGTVLGLADNTGNSFGSHLHLTLKKLGSTYQNWPYSIVDPTPFLVPLMGWQKPVGPFTSGWVNQNSITILDDLAQAHPDGISLRVGPEESYFVPGGTIMLLTGTPTGQHVAVQVPDAALNKQIPITHEQPAPPPPPTVMTVDGWIWEKLLHHVDNQAVVVARHGVNLRTEPDSNSHIVGVVSADSTVGLLGNTTNDYLPVRVRRVDFLGPVQTSTQLPEAARGSLRNLPADIYLGWVQTHFLQLDRDGRTATTRHKGVYMRTQPNPASQFVGMIKGDATVSIAGQVVNQYTPVLADKDMMFDLVTNSREDTLIPTPFADAMPPEMPPSFPIQETTPAWVLTTDLTVEEPFATNGDFTVQLYDAPRRNGKLLGSLPAKTRMLYTGVPLGEFTPVRVNVVDIVPPTIDTIREPEPGPYGRARIGLHASADPAISEAEHQEFGLLRPGIIKVLSFHDPKDIQRLAAAHGDASWIVRAFLDWGGRPISPSEFVQYTLSDVSRSLNALPGKDVVVELHNEPNLVAEGWRHSWQNGADFARWWLDVLASYRQALPGVRFIYPGLSPGSSVSGIKQDHVEFIETSRTAVAAADGLGVHLYWSNVYPMQKSLDVLDGFITRFRNTPIWITEASNNKSGTTTAQKGQEYLQFWHELQKRPIVQGVTYFVASASNPAFAEEVWVGRNLGKIIGAR